MSAPERTSATVTPIRASWDVPSTWRDTPLGDLVAYHALGKPHRRHDRAEVLVAACMDHRIALRIPDGFAYVLRVGGANLAPLAFAVSYAIGLKGVRFVAVVAHGDCGAAHLMEKRAAFVDGLIRNAGWRFEDAERHFDAQAPLFALADPPTFSAREAERIEREYPGTRAVALFYDVTDGSLGVVTA